MQILGSLLFMCILFSMNWNFSYSEVTVQAAGDLSFVAENDLKAYLKTNPTKFKIHFKWIKRSYWKKLHFCSRTRGEKLNLCKQVLGSKFYYNLEVDETKPDPTECIKLKFRFYGDDKNQLPETEGKQVLYMYPCRTNTKSRDIYFLSGTGDQEPSLYLFYRSREKDANDKHTIYFASKVTNIDMKDLKAARKIEKKRQLEMYYQSLQPEVDEAADAGPLIPL